MITETIFDGKSFIIPMCDVVAIEKLNPAITPPYSYRVIMAGTTFNHEAGDYNNDILLRADEGKSFLKAWCKYRSEVDYEGESESILPPCLSPEYDKGEPTILSDLSSGSFNNMIIHSHTQMNKKGFPKIMKSNNGLAIVAFMTPEQGYVARCSPDFQYKVGDYRNDWIIENFVCMKGDIIDMKHADIFSIIQGSTKNTFDFLTKL